MKFARYLEDTQTAEWKRAYIDYRGLKKCISAIRLVQEGVGSKSDSDEDGPHNKNRASGQACRGSEDRPGSRLSALRSAYSTARQEQEAGYPHLSQASTWPKRPSIVHQAISSIKRSNGHSTLRRSTAPLASLPLCELMPELTPQEVAFFDYLDAQLEKVESFYSDREKELLRRTQLLQGQLRGLHDHGKLIRESSTYNEAACLSAVATTLKLKVQSHPVLEIPNIDSRLDDGEFRRIPPPKGKATSTSSGTRPSTRSTISSTVHGIIASSEQAKATSSVCESRGRDPLRHSLRANYQYARKKLKKAVFEHYRGLELLQNYRILNLTGFRKALKKFEKVTKIRVQEQYMTEKVDQSALASPQVLQAMIKEMQELYANTFLRGDSRKAMRRLRHAGDHIKHHHSSTFRSGIVLGLSVPALAHGTYCAFLEETHDDIQAWRALLFVYGVLVVPAVYSLLVGLNLLVWARSRVNYTFIFELNHRTRMDYREYFEIPSLFFTTLCYAFWLSFARIGSSYISPTIWPLAWLALVIVILLSPLPILFRSSRFWLLKSVGKLFLSGTRRVEFADFWMGDQLCSLVYTLSSLPVLVCIYTEDFSEGWSTCGSRSNYWPVALGLAGLPSLIRLIQSLKRYTDSGLVTHLINGGKYGSGILNYVFYFLWRQRRTRLDLYFALWVIFATISSSYSSCWDLLMDWSLLKSRSKNFLLRNNLGYPGHIYLYYVAMVTNCLIRFGWVIYIPEQGPSMLLRSFILGFLEMMRRVQWNFFRVENEHLGNTDQYRVTREVPLPYTFEVNPQDDD